MVVVTSPCQLVYTISAVYLLPLSKGLESRTPRATASVDNLLQTLGIPPIPLCLIIGIGSASPPFFLTNSL